MRGRPLPPSVAEVEDITKLPFEAGADRCHGFSLALVKSRWYPRARVARGTCRGVRSQHSWIALGNPYHPDTPIWDPTLWAHGPYVTGVWSGTLSDGLHKPHGAGSIWAWGRPPEADNEADAVELTPSFELSEAALAFLDILGPLDRRGWAILANAPVQEWPAGEILAAMDDTPELSALVPIDVLGMVTDRNPGGLYLPGGEKPAVA